jgi:ceramide glucosyltransferase
MITQFPLFWALAALLLSGGATWTWIGLALAAGLRYIIAQQLERRLGFSGRGRGSPALASTPAPWLFLLRDMVSAAIFVMSFWSDTVEWRGNVLEADSGRSDSGRQAEAAPRHMN